MAAPRLRFRPTLEADLAEVADLLPPWLPFDGARWQALWRRLLHEAAPMSTVMEDLAQPAGRRIQGCGCGLALPSEWVARLGLDGATLQPRSPIVPQVYAGLFDGSLVLPSDRELGVLNAQGRVHFLNLHYVQRPVDLHDDYALAVLNVANEAFRTAVSGWRLQAMHFESSARDAVMFASAGFPLVPYRDCGPWDHRADAAFEDAQSVEGPHTSFLAVQRRGTERSCCRGRGSRTLSEQRHRHVPAIIQRRRRAGRWW